ncbi:MAG: bifunctional riboflavin kinase/FAD synthetase [Peptococcaceae bacterium]|nr:bifunctional riboflavin kinase/FAD synthetase [Peptococcaceae bacterium]
MEQNGMKNQQRAVGNPGTHHQQTDCVIALGNFDGVHIGHQALLRRGLDYARPLGLPLAALLFAPHPQLVLQPDRPFCCLTDLEEKTRVLTDFGVDNVLVYPFTRDFAALTPREFVLRTLVPLSPVRILVGYNYAFGQNARGRAEHLAEMGNEWGFAVDVLPEQRLAGLRVSSTDIRQALDLGQVEGAARMLGRPYRLRGTVEEGCRRGRELGFPTANLCVNPDVVIPGMGVYVGKVLGQGQEKQGDAVINIGVNPTFAEKWDGGSQWKERGLSDIRVEVHILNFQGDLYGQPLGVDFLTRLRAEKKFASSAHLVEQIRLDITAARGFLARGR